MSMDTPPMFSSSDALWLQVVNEGVEDRVEVNQRMLIDKMLARYSSDFVVCRELIQNSDDAQASSFHLEITCDTTNRVSTIPPSINNNTKDQFENNSRQSTTLFEDIGRLFRTHWKNTTMNFGLEENDSTDLSPPETSSALELDFHNSIITEIRSVNNGIPFTEADWKRVATIAEGNTNVDAIGQFGVGFFSVFSYSERPIIQSGKHCMAFVWQNGRSLTTFRKELPVDEQQQQPSITSVILKMRNKLLLHTKSARLEMNSTNNKLKSSRIKKHVQTNEIVPTMDLTQLKIYFTKVLSFTKYINELVIKINGSIVFQVNKTKKTVPSIVSALTLTKKAPSLINDYHLLRFESFLQTEQTFAIANGPSITLNHVDVQASLNIDKELHEQIRRVLKKSLPAIVHIQLLFPSNKLFEEQQWHSSVNNDLNIRILKTLIPLKFHENQILPSGQVFIGLATHQSTGIGMHVYSHLIPTIERENLDLQDPYITIWNEELLASIGKIARLVYDQAILDGVSNAQDTNQRFDALLAPYAFQPSVPNKEIGGILLEGFFSSTKPILVPVKRSPSAVQLALIPSTQAYLSNSKYIQLFLPIPLVPFDIGQNDFFKTLKSRRLIHEIDLAIILDKLHEAILLSNEFVQLLHWLCSGDVNNKNYVKEILSIVHFRETSQSPIMTFDKLEFYDIFNISSLLPLPSNVLPASIAGHLSREELHKRLSLSALSVKNLVHFYLHESQQHLFSHENTSTILLSFISQHWDQLNQTDWARIKLILSNMRCIPTSQGMKLPNESYIRSSNLSSDLPTITLHVPQNVRDENEKQTIDRTDNPVSIDFLKWIGCRTIHVPTLADNLPVHSNEPSINSQTIQIFIQDLLKQRKTMSDGDLNALKQSACLIGTTLVPNDETTRKYVPSDLHFPSVANRLQWPNLPIIDWPDIDPRSREYAFLKEIGVREAPELSKLIDRIAQEHADGSKTRTDYKLPIALVFFAEHFQQHYSKLWKTAKIKRAFLPSQCPDLNKVNEVVLSEPDTVFKDPSPLFSSLLSEVIRLFAHYFDVALLGVRECPTLPMAFEILMERKNELLTIESAPKFFAYLNKLDGLNRPFIERISNLPFIPLPGSKLFVKPSQVFIRTKTPAPAVLSQQNNNTQLVDDTDTQGLIDYIDYGPDANSFLLGIGVLHHPSPEMLAELLIDRQANYFAHAKDDTGNLLSAKVRVYINCLKQLAAVSNWARQLNVEPLRTRLINKPWCLGYQTIERPNGSKDRILKIAKPSEIYLDDDHQCAIDLRPLCAPDEPELTKLYERFGSKWLSECVKRTLVHRGRCTTTDRSDELCDLILYRLDMLFVNNRGERMENVDAKHIELLRTKLSVYEADGIQCQLTFQNSTITLNSTECSSCALEYRDKKVALYFRRDLPTFDFIDIASELARFVFNKPLDAVVHAISDKLASPLETLKRRGIPVDRLLKSVEHQPIMMAPPPPPPTEQTKPDEQQQQQLQQLQQQQVQQFQRQLQQQQQSEQQRPFDFLQSLRNLLVPDRPSVQNSHHIESTIERDCVKNFKQYQTEDDTTLRTMLQTGRAYVQPEFHQPKHSKNEINNSCEAVPAANMTRVNTLFHSIPLYLEQNVPLTNTMIDQAKQLAWILAGLALYVFKMPVETMHLFRDIDSARIAFNNNGALFFNLRYFEQVFADDLQPYLHNSSPSTIPIVRTIVNFYFMVTCHELSHNIDSAHNLNFISRLERVSVKFMDEKDAFLEQFSFKNSF